MRKILVAIAILVLAVPLLAVAGCSKKSYSISVGSKSALGTYLVDGKGMTLYYTAKDQYGKSLLTGNVIAAWPIFYAQSVTVPSSLNASDFTTITRDDGYKQTAYKGWPLYYRATDQAKGDTTGEGTLGIWFVARVPFYTVMIENTADLGSYLVDSRGKTLYYTTRDSSGKSNVAANLLSTWPVFYTGERIVPSTIKASDLGTITRADGQKQSTWRGWPLYTYSRDQASGDTLGNDASGVWSVIDPAKLAAAP